MSQSIGRYVILAAFVAAISFQNKSAQAGEFKEIQAHDFPSNVMVESFFASDHGGYLFAGRAYEDNKPLAGYWIGLLGQKAQYTWYHQINIGKPGSNPVGVDLMIDAADDGYWAIGYRLKANEPADSPYKFISFAYVAKVNAQGVPSPSKTDMTVSRSVQCAKAVADGVIVAGTKSAPLFFPSLDGNNQIKNYHGDVPWIAKYNQSGEIVWEKIYTSNDGNALQRYGKKWYGCGGPLVDGSGNIYVALTVLSTKPILFNGIKVLNQLEDVSTKKIQNLLIELDSDGKELNKNLLDSDGGQAFLFKTQIGLTLYDHIAPVFVPYISNIFPTIIRNGGVRITQLDDFLKVERQKSIRNEEIGAYIEAVLPREGGGQFVVGDNIYARRTLLFLNEKGVIDGSYHFTSIGTDRINLANTNSASYSDTLGNKANLVAYIRDRRTLLFLKYSDKLNP